VPGQAPANDPTAAFGPNEWLVEALYQQYLQDKSSVDQAWWEFFADYQPTDAGNGNATDTGMTPAVTSAPPQPVLTPPAPVPAPAAPVPDAPAAPAAPAALVARAFIR
jgi:multifunctional 2-oxoglutarate metabolism enzyme